MNEKCSFIQDVIEKAKTDPKHIVFPEGKDARILEAAHIITQEKIADITILGEEENIRDYYGQKGYDFTGISIVDPSHSEEMPHFVELLYLLRKHKGITLDQAKDTCRKNNYFGTLMLYEDKADGLISGASHSTADTVRPALQIIKASKKASTVSSMFFMCFPQKTYVFADCGLVEDPDFKQLADIAVQSALTAIQFGFEANVAMLSYSTKGSANSPAVEKVAKATQLAKEIFQKDYPDLSVIIDGEIQADAAIVPSVGEKKCPESALKGNANVLIFPDLNAGNIAYKLTQRLGGADAYGPVLQGLKKPVNDLSRGCSIEDIVGVTALTVVQCQMKNI